MMPLLTFLRARRAASAAEFALVLPAALLLLFGVIDVGHYAWVLNEYEKATQMGTRYAVVTDVVSVGLASDTLTYIGEPYCRDTAGTLVNCAPGDRIDASALGSVVCTAQGCTVSGNTPPNAAQVETVAFGKLVTHMRRFQPRIADGAVAVEYRGSGLGYAGDPSKPEIAPLVTVRVNNAVYNPIVLSPLNLSVPLPDFSYSLTMEDGEGASAS